MMSKVVSISKGNKSLKKALLQERQTFFSKFSGRNKIKFLGFIAIIAIIAFSMTACDWIDDLFEDIGAPRIKTSSLPDGTYGIQYKQTLSVSGAKPITWTLDSGSLPTGLTLSTGGVISGTPTAVETFTFTIKATNEEGEDTAYLSITIAALKIDTTSLPNGTKDKAYSPQTLKATGATGYTTFTWTRDSGSLPPGLTLSTGGVISGTPTSAGKFTFTVKATNTKGSATKQLSITIAGPGPKITTESLPKAKAGESYNYTLTATGDTPITWSISKPYAWSDDLPEGLTLSTSGVISGTPTSEGSTYFTVAATDSKGQTTVKSLSIIVVTWTEILNIPFADTEYSVRINGLVWGNDKFVAVGSYGQMVTSPNGINWTRVDPKFGTSSIYKIAWGSNKFIAVGASGKMATSSNGTSWTLVEDHPFTTFSIITWVNDRFIATGNVKLDNNETGYDRMATSTDGVTWTLVNVENYTFNSIKSIVWGNNKFVAVGSSNILTSTDGVIWAKVQNHGLGNQIEDIAWGDNKFIAILSSSTVIGSYTATSTDGVTWTKVDSTAGGSMFCVTYGNNKFVAGGILHMEYSENGTTEWTEVRSNNFYDNGLYSINYIVWGNDRFVAAGGDQIWYSVTNW
ncbi:MAG: Ig domain-containing protein [Treponema sp.]|nr:Ig domain-containing protein [Treponema sp.]